jgi:hypothetical protein
VSLRDPLQTVIVDGVGWNDINWPLPLHQLEHCDHCGSDGAEGHQNACYYLLKNWTPAAHRFHTDRLSQALQREVAAGLR